MRATALLLFLASGHGACAGEAMWGVEELRGLVVDALRAQGRDAVSGQEIGPIDPRVSLPACERPQVAQRGAGGRTFQIQCPDWSRIVQLRDAPAAKPERSGEREHASATIVTARVELAAGALLTEADLDERVVAAPAGGGHLRSRADAVGLRLTAAVAPGAALTQRHVARAPAILRGETITLVADGSGFEISIPGRAEQDGFQGEVIAVRNLRSGALLKGRIQTGKVVSVLRL